MKLSNVGVDSNILVYAELEPDSDKGARAAAVIGHRELNLVLPVQSLLEFLHVVRKRRPDKLNDAAETVSILMLMFGAAPTTDAVMWAAVDLVRKNHLQVWDAVILAATQQAGARVLLSEDMQDGAVLGGVQIVNPFASDLAALTKRVSQA